MAESRGSRLTGGGGGGGWGAGTQGKFGLRCAAEAFKPRPKQKLFISLPCLRQETLLSDSDFLCFAYRNM